jgi:hypothetical protein
VYVIVFKDGEVSDPLIINTAEGGEDVDWIWGDEPYKKYYVASYGDNGNTGDKRHPLKTVQQALEKLVVAYTQADWPEKGTDLESPGAIIILDTVSVTAQITIDGSVGYPPIVLCSDPAAADEDPQGKLQATTAIGSGNNLVILKNGAKLTLTGSLIVAGTDNQSDNIRGLYVETNSTFTMSGGEISGNSSSSSSYGGGVYIKGTFTMSGGEISRNSISSSSTSPCGGGVYIDNGTFTMSGGKISGNSVTCSASNAYGGGVRVRGTFTMSGGEISGNSVSSATNFSFGGGVYVDEYGTFIMSDGEISRNSVSSYNINGGGGGVYVSNLSTRFAKTGGTIYGYTSTDPYSNKVTQYPTDAILANKGHAVYVRNTSYHKETKVGPKDQLFYKYPLDSDISGW